MQMLNFLGGLTCASRGKCMMETSPYGNDQFEVKFGVWNLMAHIVSPARMPNHYVVLQQKVRTSIGVWVWPTVQTVLASSGVDPRPAKINVGSVELHNDVVVYHRGC